MSTDLPHALRFPAGEVPGGVTRARELLARPDVRGLALVVALEDGSLRKLSCWEAGAGFTTVAGLTMLTGEAASLLR